eukprot:scaffold3697_cov20-Tisochrysis_lutea.AAC.3
MHAAGPGLRSLFFSFPVLCVLRCLCTPSAPSDTLCHLYRTCAGRYSHLYRTRTGRYGCNVCNTSSPACGANALHPQIPVQAIWSCLSVLSSCHLTTRARHGGAAATAAAQGAGAAAGATQANLTTLCLCSDTAVQLRRLQREQQERQQAREQLALDEARVAQDKQRWEQQAAEAEIDELEMLLAEQLGVATSGAGQKQGGLARPTLPVDPA